jgi:hypothetical protein
METSCFLPRSDTQLRRRKQTHLSEAVRVCPGPTHPHGSKKSLSPSHTTRPLTLQRRRSSSNSTQTLRYAQGSTRARRQVAPLQQLSTHHNTTARPDSAPSVADGVPAVFASAAAPRPPSVATVAADVTAAAVTVSLRFQNCQRGVASSTALEAVGASGCGCDTCERADSKR